MKKKLDELLSTINEQTSVDEKIELIEAIRDSIVAGTEDLRGGRKNEKHRKGNGEGSFSVRTNGTYMYRVMVGRKANGKPDIKCFYGKTQTICKEKYEEFKWKRKQKLDTTKKYKFSEIADRWLEQHASEITPTTYESYTYMMKHLKNHFGEEYVDDITTEQITEFLKDFRNKYSDSYRAQARGMLFQIFKYAVACRLIIINPVAQMDKLRSKDKGKKKKRKDVFTAEEVREVLKNLPRDNRYVHGFILMLGTGMRGQELLALEPRYISSDGREIQVEQAVKRVKGRVYLGDPKTSKSYRSVPVAEFAQESARILRDTDKIFVFEGRKKGKPCCPETFREHLYESLDKAGMRRLQPHCCRHTYISLMQEIGVDMETIMDIVGHEDIDMTRHYLHVQRSIRESAAEIFSAHFRENNTENI